MNSFLSRFRRITSSGVYMTEVDGLRFLAIISVLIFHIRGAFITFLEQHPGVDRSDLTKTFLYPVLINGNQGVEIFFAISGFILAVPFISYYRYNKEKISLKKFYLRRLTRLEPPYVLALILLFIGLIIRGDFTFWHLFPNLLASIFYQHNIIFKQLPKVTSVAWSLEIEVQFYLITPFILVIFKAPKLLVRLIILGVIVLMPFLQNIVPTSINWIYKFFQYFAVGILLADLYLDKNSFLHKLKPVFFFFAGIPVFIALLLTNAYVSATASSYTAGNQVLLKLIYPFMILVFFSLVLGNDLWKKMFSIPVIAVIGGMCYSIYLLHTAIISAFGGIIFKHALTGSIGFDFFIYLIALLALIIVISSVFFILVEKPCMKKDWYKNILKKKPKPLGSAA